MAKQDNDGFSVISEDIPADAWFKNHPGRVIQGVVLAAQKRKDEDDKERLIYLIRLTKPCEGKPIGEDGTELFNEGSVFLLSESFGLKELRKHVETYEGIEVRLTCIEKVSLGGPRTMWKWKVEAKGGKPRKVALNLDLNTESDEDASSDDDIPF